VTPQVQEPALIAFIGGAIAVAFIAFVLGFAPQKLLAGRPGHAGVRRTGALVSVSAATLGLAAYALGTALGGLHVGLGLGFAAAALGSIFVVDLRFMVIPDVQVLAVGLLAFFGPIKSDLVQAGLGALTGAVLLFLVREAFLRLRKIEALGFGDVKLMAAIGALTGPKLVLWVIVAASVLGAIFALVRNRGRIPGAPAVPFGAMAALPALAVIAASRLWGLG